MNYLNTPIVCSASYYQCNTNGTDTTYGIVVDDSSVTWESAKEALNQAIIDWNTTHPDEPVNFRYEINTDPVTSATQPLILVEV